MQLGTSCQFAKQSDYYLITFCGAGLNLGPIPLLLASRQAKLTSNSVIFTSFDEILTKNQFLNP